MKKYITIILALVFLVNVQTVQAAEIVDNPDNIENNSYIIGQHLFTDETILTTEHIMLAAKTIEGNNLSDMIIYYKTPRGKWINGLSGEIIEPPTNMDIRYINLGVESLDTPVISNSLIGKEDTGDILYTVNIDYFDGDYLEVYGSEDGINYSLLEHGEKNNLTLKYEVAAGIHKYFKVRSYVEINGTTHYSDYSNVVDYDNYLVTPFITIEFDDGDSEDSSGNVCSSSLIYIHPFEKNDIEVWYSDAIDGEYNLYKTVAGADVTQDYNGNYMIEIGSCVDNVGEEYPSYYYKIRSFAKPGSEIIYSDFSNIVSINEEIVPPVADFAGDEEDGSSNYDLKVPKHGSGVRIYYGNKKYGNFEYDLDFNDSIPSDYTLLKTIDWKNAEENNLVNVPFGELYYYRFVYYVTKNGEIIDLFYLPEYDIFISNGKPELTANSIMLDGENNTLIYQLRINPQENSDIEIYYSEDNVNYTLLRTVPKDNTNIELFKIGVPENKRYYVKVRYKYDADAYSSYSEHVICSNGIF